MQQRRVRLGDILDDYCPRERRVTNHVVVAMIEEQVKQTRCSTCEAEHEYKGAKIPPPRRKKTALSKGDGEGVIRPRPAGMPEDDMGHPDEPIADADLTPHDGLPAEPAGEQESEGTGGEQDEWPVHRRLIRATLPRPEGQTPERKAPDFTFRPGGAGGRFDANRNGKRHRGRRPMRHGEGGQPRQGSGHSQGGGQRQRQGGGGGPQGQRHGNRPGPGGGRPGQGRGPRQGPGPGKKRGR